MAIYHNADFLPEGSPSINPTFPAAVPTVFTAPEAYIPMTHRQYALFFKRVRQVTISGTANGNPFSFVSTAWHADHSSIGDELDAHQNGQQFYLDDGFDSGNYVIFVTLDNGNPVVVPNTAGDLDDGGTTYWVPILIQISRIASDEDQDTVMAGNQAHDTGANPTSGSAFSVIVAGVDAVFGETANIPVPMVYRTLFGGPPLPDIAGSMLIEATEFYSFDGAFEVTTGART